MKELYVLRIEESYGQEICLSGHLHQLLGILNELRCHFKEIAEEAERDIDSFEELATPAIVSTARNEGVGRPRLALAQEQLGTLLVVGFIILTLHSPCLKSLENENIIMQNIKEHFQLRCLNFLQLAHISPLKSSHEIP